MRRIACCAMFIAGLATSRTGLGDPREPAAAGKQPDRQKVWQVLEYPTIVPKAVMAKPSREDEKTASRLSEEVSLHFDDAPLANVIREIAKLAEVNIFVDSAGLEDEGVTVNTNVSINVDDTPLNGALAQILEPLRLGYTVKDDVLKITSRVKTTLVTATYAVADIVATFPSGADIAASFPQGDAAPIPKLTTKDSSFDVLMALILTTIQPDSWEEARGPGSMMPYRKTHRLVIQHVPAVHDEIADLLGRLRRLADQTVVLKMAILTAPAGKLPRFAKAGALDREAGKNVDRAPADAGFVVREAHARLLVKYVAHRPTASIDLLPRFCLANGQTTEFVRDAPAAVAQDAASYGFRIHAVISCDRKAVRLKIVAPVADSPDTAGSITFTARDHETVVCDVTALLETYRSWKAGESVAGREDGAREADGAAPNARPVREFLVITPQVLAPVEEEEELGVELPKR